MPTTINIYGDVIEKLQDSLVSYLNSKGCNVVVGKNFKCINPAHDDKSPSCGIVPETQSRVFHCFGCGAVGSIFTAAAFLDNRPLTGVGFIHETVAALAEQFGVELPTVQLTPEDQHEMDVYRAYRDATQLVLTSHCSDRIEAKITQYGWSKLVRLSLGVGSVTSYEDFIEKMINHHGWSKDFLKEIDLHRKSMFNENNLIFTVRDESGNPVGFACRNLLYEDQVKGYEEKCKVLRSEPESEERTKALTSLHKPTKYINSMEKSHGDETSLRNWIYQKSKRLFGLHKAKDSTPPLYIFEGYSDCVTAVNCGISNSAAIGSTSFTKDHLDLILSLGIKHLIFVLDADDAGEDGTDRFVKLLEDNVGGHIGLRVEVIAMPPGTDDPDAYIRTYGVKSFRDLPKTDIFGWSLKRAIKEGEDPEVLAIRMVNLIVNDQSNFVRMRKAKQLSEATGINEDIIWREITSLVDSELSQIEEEKSLVANQVAKQLQLKPKSAEVIIKAAQEQLDELVSRRRGYSVASTKSYIDAITETQRQNKKTVELSTGWPLFDKWVGGIPRSDAFITVPGKMNQGKSSFLSTLAWRLLEYNSENTMVLYHTIDDSMATFLPRVWASKFDNLDVTGNHQYFNSSYVENTPDEGIRNGWYSNDWKTAGWHLEKTHHFTEIYNQSMAWTDKLIDSERFVPEDASTLAPSLPALESRIKGIRQKFPERNLVVIADNFHLYDLPGYAEGENKISHMSIYIKGLVNKYHCTIIMTMELPKSALERGVRPLVRNIKGSASMSYDSSLNIGVYNDIKDYGDASELIEQFDSLKDPNTEVVPYRKPVIELVFDKSKINSFDGRIYYGLEPRSGSMFEYPYEGGKYTQVYFREIAAGKKGAKEEIAFSKAPNKSLY